MFLRARGDEDDKMSYNNITKYVITVGDRSSLDVLASARPVRVQALQAQTPERQHPDVLH